MAKQKTLSVIVHIASVVWFRDLNRARPTGDYGKAEELKDSMTTRGWVIDEDGTVKVKKATDEHKARAQKERAEKWESLKGIATADSTKLVELSTFEQIYVEGGKIRPVEYVGITGNRRDSVFFAAMAARKRENLEITTEIPVIVREYATPLAELAEQIGENELKSLGFNPTTAVDKLLAAKAAVELGATQSDLRTVFKDGIGQKLWGVIQLNSRFPDMGIIQRMCLKPDDDGYIRLESVKTADLPTMVMRTDSKALAEKNEKLLLQGKEQIKPATADDVARFFALPQKGTGNELKVMKGDSIRGLADNFPIMPLRAMAKAIASNNTDGLKVYQAAALGFNMLDSLLAEGDYPPMELLLLKVVQAKGDARTALIGKLLKAVE